MDEALLAGVALSAALAGAGVVLVVRLCARLRAAEERLARLPTAEELAGVAGGLLTPFGESVRTSLAEVRDRVSEIAGLLDDLARRPAPGPAPAGVGEEVEPLLREAVEALDGRLAEILRVLAAAPGERLEDTLTRELGARGFTDVRAVAEPKLEAEGLRVRVEGRREGMTFKGSVLVVGSRVVSHRLAPAHPMFP